MGLILAGLGFFAPACSVVDQVDNGWALLSHPSGAVFWLAVPPTAVSLEGMRLCPTGIEPARPFRFPTRPAFAADFSL